MTEKLSDCLQTPDWLFKELDEEFHFNIDLCATKENSKCVLFCTDYINNMVGSVYNTMNYPCFQEYIRENLLNSGTCFMNPPYSNPKPFIEKAWEDSKHCKIVALVKCDPSTKWWATFWYYDDIKLDKTNSTIPSNFGKTLKTRGPKRGCEVRFFPKRIKFDPPKGYKAERVTQCGSRVTKEPIKLSGTAFPCALLIFDRRGF